MSRPGYEQSEDRSAAKRRYDASEKGRAARQRYAAGEKHRNAHRQGDAKRKALKYGASFVEPVSALVVLELHDGVCGICGHDVDPFKFDVDHIIPLVRGGEHSYRNTQPAHPSCNRRKGTS